MFQFAKKANINKKYDVVIIGGGPAGIGAGIYAKRAGANTIIIDAKGIGGNIANTWLVDNYPGIPSVSGQELSKKYKEHLIHLEVDFLEYSPVKKIDLNKKEVVLYDDNIIEGKSIVLAMGVKPKLLGIPGEEKFYGKGISTCAICDAPFYKNMVVGVVGGGDSAIKEAIYISNIAKEVYLIHRRSSFRAEQANIDQLKAKSNVKFILDSVVKEVYGEEKVEGVKIENLNTGKIENIKLDGLFIFIGYQPNTELVKGQIELKDDYIVTNQDYMTSIPGVFAAGDIRYGSFKQLITAISEGAIAGYNAAHYSQKVK